MEIKNLLNDIYTLNSGSFQRRYLRYKLLMLRWAAFTLRRIKGKKNRLNDIPVIINNRNRYAYLLQLIEWLEKAGLKNISIIDNDSSYAPLLEYYKKTPYKVYFLGKNTGHLALWKSHVYKKFKCYYYIYTDPDILPSEDSRYDFLQFMMYCLKKYPDFEKVGFGLRIDDLPDHYNQKQKVIDWEKQFWEKKIEEDVYYAPVDTTFALYRPFTNFAKRPIHSCRITGKYTARHLTWYEDSSHPTEEELYYKQHIREGASHWTSKE